LLLAGRPPWYVEGSVAFPPHKLLFSLAHICVLACLCVLGSGSAARAEAGRPACSWLLGLAHSGSTGLFDLPLADPGCPWQLRMGVLGHGFVQYNFLLTEDRNEQMSGAVQLGATLGSYFELWAQFGTRANRNQRPSADSSLSAQPTLALGRTALGLKLHSAWGRLAHVAVQPTLRVHSGPFDFGPRFPSADGGVELLGSLDLSALRLPLRLSARAGYLHDRTSSLIAGLDCMAQGSAECLSTRLVYTTAYDVGQPRVELGLGADAHFEVGAGMSLGPLLSYTLAVVTGDGDPVLRAQLAMQMPAVPVEYVDGRVAQRLSLGARLLLPWPVSIDLGVQVALSSWGYAMGPKLPQVAGYGSLAFALDMSGAASGARNRDERSPAARHAPPAESVPGIAAAPGRVRGVVRDAQTKTPLADAVVRFIGAPENALLTDEHGSYLSGPLPAGPLAVEASRGDHQTSRVAAVVRSGETVAVNLELLQAARGAPALLWVELSDELTGTPPPARATLFRAGQSRGQTEGPRPEQVVEMASQTGGLYARLPAGSWRLRIDAVGYLSREQMVVLPASAERRLSLRLSRRPQVPRARLGGGEISLAEPLAFAGDSQHPQLVPASIRLLDEVIDLLIHHPELRQVRIEAVGQGSEAQLIAVRDRLIQGGIAPERVIAVEASADPRHDRPFRIQLRVR